MSNAGSIRHRAHENIMGLSFFDLAMNFSRPPGKGGICLTDMHSGHIWFITLSYPARASQMKVKEELNKPTDITWNDTKIWILTEGKLLNCSKENTYNTKTNKKY